MNLEEQAKNKEFEFKALQMAVALNLREGTLDVETLNRVMERSFKLGHNAGHCRGENFKYTLLDEYKQSIRELEAQVYAQY